MVTSTKTPTTASTSSDVVTSIVLPNKDTPRVRANLVKGTAYLVKNIDASIPPQSSQSE